MVRYSKDPYWLEARFNSKCSKCNEPINKGQKIFYYPLTKDVFSTECAKAASRDFTSLANYEDNMY